MERSEPTKNLPYARFYKRTGDIIVPLSGAMLLSLIAMQFARYTDSVVRLALASIALGVLVIGVAFVQNRRALNGMDGNVGDKFLSRMYRTSTSMAMFGYSICMMALTIARPH